MRHIIILNYWPTTTTIISHQLFLLFRFRTHFEKCPSTTYTGTRSISAARNPCTTSRAGTSNPSRWCHRRRNTTWTRGTWRTMRTFDSICIRRITARVRAVRTRNLSAARRIHFTICLAESSIRFWLNRARMRPSMRTERREAIICTAMCRKPIWWRMSQVIIIFIKSKLRVRTSSTSTSRKLTIYNTSPVSFCSPCIYHLVYTL